MELPALPARLLMAALCLLCVPPAVLTDDCAPYVGPDFTLHRGQTCVLSFCSGSCTNRYCNIIPGTALDQGQFMCILNNLYVVIGAGIVISLLIVAGVITCFCKSLCLCCNLCFPRRQERLTTAVAVTNVLPHQPLMVMPPSSGYRPLATHSVTYDQTGKACQPPPYPGEGPASFHYPAK